MGSWWLGAGFSGLSLVMVAAVAVLVAHGGRREDAGLYTLGGLVWCGITYGAAAMGWLAQFDPPPPITLVLLGGFGLVGLVSRSRLGTALAAVPVAWLIAVQSFRVVVELLIHEAVVQGVAPPQMSWGGYNFDIVPAVTAPLVAWAVHTGRAGRGLVIAWSVLGLAMLAGVVTAALLSMPTPFQVLHPDNTWVAHPPFVWLPAVLVTTALILHVAILRAVLRPPA